MKKLETVPVGELQPGMRLASPVADEAGRILLPEGTELSESTIAALGRREIEAVRVELEVEDDPAVVEQYRRLVAERLDHLFRRAGEGAETRALYQAIVEYRMEHRS